MVTTPRSGFEVERRTAATSMTERSTSPGRTGFKNLISSMPGEAMMARSQIFRSKNSRIVRQMVCRPEATSPPKGRARRRDGIEMEILRVEFLREGHDLRL